METHYHLLDVEDSYMWPSFRLAWIKVSIGHVTLLLWLALKPWRVEIMYLYEYNVTGIGGAMSLVSNRCD